MFNFIFLNKWNFKLFSTANKMVNNFRVSGYLQRAFKCKDIMNKIKITSSYRKIVIIFTFRLFNYTKLSFGTFKWNF